MNGMKLLDINEILSIGKTLREFSDTALLATATATFHQACTEVPEGILAVGPSPYPPLRPPPSACLHTHIASNDTVLYDRSDRAQRLLGPPVPSFLSHETVRYGAGSTDRESPHSIDRPPSPQVRLRLYELYQNIADR